MIIESMEQFGKAVDEGKELELLLSKGIDDPEEYWGPLARYRASWGEINDLIKEDRIRTAPTTTYYRIYKIIDGGPQSQCLRILEQTIPFPVWSTNTSSKHLFDHSIESED